MVGMRGGSIGSWEVDANLTHTSNPTTRTKARGEVCRRPATTVARMHRPIASRGVSLTPEEISPQRSMLQPSFSRRLDRGPCDAMVRRVLLKRRTVSRNSGNPCLVSYMGSILPRNEPSDKAGTVRVGMGESVADAPVVWTLGAIEPLVYLFVLLLESSPEKTTTLPSSLTTSTACSFLVTTCDGRSNTLWGVDSIYRHARRRSSQHRAAG